MTAVLELSHVTKLYDGSPPVRALDDVSLTVRRGELVGIVGRSGSGKSTLLNMIGTLDRPTSGTVHITGWDLAELSDARIAGVRAHAIGFVFQHFHLIDGLSALENVAVGLAYRGTHRDEALERSREALTRVGLADRSHHAPGKLSGGESQRVAIARAIVGEPAILVADEPTGNLDSHTAEEILDLILGLHSDGATVVVVTHDPEVAHRMERRVTLADGRISDDVKVGAA